MVNMVILNDSPKFESQLLSYKQDKEVEILCSVNKARVLLLLTYMWYCYVFQSNVAVWLIILFINTLNKFILFGMSHFVREMGISVLCIICKQI